MKIGFNARFLAEPYTGLGQYSRNLYSALIASFPDNKFLLYLPEGCSVPDFPGTNWKAVPIPGIPNSRFDREFTGNSAFLQNRPDMLHLPHLPLPQKSPSTPMLLTIHDLIPAVFLQWGRLLTGKTPWKTISALGLKLRFLEPGKIRKADRISTISSCSARDISRLLHYPKERITTIPNGIDPSFAAAAEPQRISEIRGKYGLGERYLINFGGQTVRKNLNKQVRAFIEIRKKHPDLQLVVTGEGEWRNRTSKREIPGLILPGRIPEEDMAPLINGAAISLYLSLYEGFGLPVLESLICSTPVLTSEKSAMAEILPGSCALANPFSIKSITASLDKMLTNIEEYEKKVRAAQPGLRKITWERAARQYMTLFQETAATSTRG